MVNSNQVSKQGIAFFTLLLFLYILGPLTRIFGLGAFEDTSFLFSVMLIIMWLLFARNFVIPKEIYYLIVAVLIVPLYMSMASLISFEGFEPPMLMLFRAVRISVVIISGYILASMMFKAYGPDTKTVLVNVILFLITAHGLLMVAQMLSPDIREFTLQYTNGGDESIHIMNREGRMAGLFGGGGAYLSVFQSFGTLLSIFLYFGASKTMKFVYILAALLCLVSALLAGRTGMYVAIAMIIFTPILINRKPLGWYLRLGVVVFLLVSSLGVLITQLYADLPNFEWLVNRTFRTLTVYMETGVFKDNTLSTLASEAVFTQDIMIYFVGLGTDDGFYGRYFQTDVGYLKYLGAFGVIGMGLVLWPYFYMLVKGIQFKNYILVFLIVTSLIVHAKEHFLFGRAAFNIVILLFCVEIISDKYNKSIRSQQS